MDVPCVADCHTRVSLPVPFILWFTTCEFSSSIGKTLVQFEAAFVIFKNIKPEGVVFSFHNAIFLHPKMTHCKIYLIEKILISVNIYIYKNPTCLKQPYDSSFFFFGCTHFIINRKREMLFSAIPSVCVGSCESAQL